MDVKLVHIQDFGTEEHSVRGKECVIGREPSCDLRPDHGKVSNRHCRLYIHAGRLMVEDLNSTNGTFVNDRQLGPFPAELLDGDELRVGPVRYAILIASNPSAMEARTAEWMASLIASKAPHSSGSSPDQEVISPAMLSARRLLDRLSSGGDEGETSHGGVRKGRLQVAEEHGVTLVKVLDHSIVEEDEIDRLARDLKELIEAGQDRITLNLGNVEHLSSQALSAFLRLQQQSQKAGGVIKICTVQKQVADLFSMTNTHNQIEIYPDEVSALESVWPQRAEPAPAETTTAELPETSRSTKSAPSALRVGLIVEVGRAQGKRIDVKSSKFLIGRDPRCHLRPNSETISRVHASIEQRDGHVFVRDYGTKNGTVLSHRILRGEEAEARNGDRLQVGILVFRLAIQSVDPVNPPSGEDDLAAWLLMQGPADADSPTALINKPPTPEPAPPPVEPAKPEPAKPEPAPAAAIRTDFRNSPTAVSQFRCELFKDDSVLVVHVSTPDLNDEMTVGPFRHDLHTLLDQDIPRNVVIDLEHVGYLSSRAVGVILAFFQRLDREGGAMRICRVHARILPVLEQMRVPRLIDIYTTLDEAVETPWTAMA